ncbi:MAG: hypothetical protein PUH44_09225 [Bacteroidales bacterium]|nr:hypothetical protein [Bacteroidales bacterium]MDY2705896.1 hypothetical protein [Alloprevotella sp.]
MAYAINISDAELQKSAVTYRKDLLVMPVIAAEATLQHMTPRPGVAGREVLGQLSGGIELGPYDPQRYDDEGLDIKPRTLETFLGSVIKRFDLNSVAKSVYGSLTTQGEALTSLDLARQVLNYLSMQLGRNLNLHIWSAKRNDMGTKTKDLFDGFDTITQKEIDAGTIGTTQGNFMQLPQAIDESNATDILMSIYESADDILQGVPTKMFVPVSVYRAYNKDYLASFGNVVYNTQFKKTYLEGTDNLCELVPLVSKKGSPFIHLTTKSNMIYGYGDGLDSEKIAIEKHHEFLLSFVATMFFGCQFEAINKERLMVAKLASV